MTEEVLAIREMCPIGLSPERFGIWAEAEAQGLRTSEAGFNPMERWIGALLQGRTLTPY